MDAVFPALLRIAVVTETYPPEVNGVARTIGMMVEGLLERGHFIQLIRPRQHRHDEGDKRAGLETLLKASIPLPKYQELRMGLPAKRALMAAWRIRRPDVVQVVTEGPLGSSALAAAKRLGVPVISEFHTNFHTYSKHYGFGFLMPVVAAYLKRLHNRGDRTLVPTEEMKERLRTVGYRHLDVVGRGIDAETFHPGRRNEGLRTEWQADARDPVVLHVGRLAPEKNLRLFVESVCAMHVVNPKLRVVMVGDGPERGPLQAAHPEFVFSGMRLGIDLATHYASADLFLFPSQTETFGNVTTEAMASGLAILAYDYAAAGQYLSHRESGLLAPYGNAAAFVELAQEMVASPGARERMGRNAAQLAQTLTWPRVIDQLEGVLYDLAGAIPLAAFSTETRKAHATA
ncbi:MAG TPA: glycosyltransferase family 1 protein [Burkholderiales bacterium]|nr:glycosyltransferase family 1 protein [Burkholderiales bacterium]